MFDISPKVARQDNRLSFLSRLIYIEIASCVNDLMSTNSTVEFLSLSMANTFDISEEETKECILELIEYSYLTQSGFNIVVNKEAMFVRKEKKEVPIKEKQVLFGNRGFRRLLDVEREEVSSGGDSIELEAYDITIGFIKLFMSNIEASGGKTNAIKARSYYKRWVHPIYLMLKNEEADIAQFREIFKFLRDDEFWKANVLSTHTIREKFDKLITAASRRNKTSVPQVMNLQDGLEDRLAQMAQQLTGVSQNLLN